MNTSTFAPSPALAPALAPAERSRLVADVSRAGSVVAPYWPLTTFVAVNPLGGFTDRHFTDATAAARAWFGARTHLPLAAFRAERDRATITDSDLDRAIVRHVADVDATDRLHADALPADVVEMLRWDLVHGPTGGDLTPATPGRDDPTAEALDVLLTTWCATYVDEAHVPWAMPDRDRGFYRAWRAVAGGDRRLAGLVGRGTGERCAALPDDPAEMLALALAAREVADEHRVDAVRTWLLRTPGWAGFARWCDDWAPADRSGARLRMIDLAAVRAAMDHLAPTHLTFDRASGEAASTEAASGEAAPTDDLRARRTDALLATFVGTAASAQQRAAVTSLLSAVGEADRAAIWLSAHEWNFRDRLLARLSPHLRDAGDPPAAVGLASRPVAQLVFCIDVRSEGLRRHLEALGDYETFGFAGFFGVPVRWRPLGSDVAEARCPVLVSPRHEVAEVAVDDDRSYLAACSATGGLHDAFHAAKGGIASPFALAESAGWFAGPVAAVRTLAPPRAPRSADATRADLAPRRSGGAWWRRAAAAPRTVAVVDDRAASEFHGGLSLEERTLFAEAIVTTIGMSDFASIVVLCGHGSITTNNPHASSLDCGACGGAPGGASARIAVAILNDPVVRTGLAERGIEIPAETWFVAGEHDTAADVVTILDGDTIPVTVAPLVADLRRDLEIAGERNADERARRLPGSANRVRDRGRDWAQVRPEWGLAGNGAFIIGPRSITAGTDLRGRAFLHSYVAERDPDGVALETIMTAPLVVAQWISSQYYFSTVDPDVFGAGDKMLHNPVGGVGVVVGQSGDLAVGLPMQSVMLGEQRAHDPLRLLAVVQAPLDRVEGIIVRNSALRQLVEGEWIHVVARPTDNDAWSLRTPTGGWEPWQRSDDSLTLLARTDLSTPLSI